jgi:hypothetical protein
MNEHDCAKLNAKVTRHSSQIQYLYESIERTNLDMTVIKESLKQIKWTVMGGLGFYVIDNIGILEALRIL